MVTTCIIIDDNALARATLTTIIHECELDLELVGEADGVVSGAKLLRHTRADLIFLDIELGDGQGFDILDIVPESGARVIFTTGSQDYAIKAFRYAAIDYLLKPVDSSALTAAVHRALALPQYSAGQQAVLQANKNQATAQRLALHTSEEIRVVEIQDIIRLEASGNYTQFYFRDGTKLLISRTLKEYSKTLGDGLFIRTHQSHLINIAYIKSYIKTEGGYIEMKDGSTIPVSVRKKSAVMAALSML